MAQELFDKIVNIQFVKKDGTSDFFLTPERGMKPEISLKGRFITASQAQMIELRVTNFYPSAPLNEYKVLNITAGYFGGLQTTISGSVWIAYQESPGPDGVTYFQLFLGDFTKWLNVPFNNTYPQGTPLTTILFDIATALGLLFVGNGLEGITTQSPLSFPPGFVKDAVNFLNIVQPDIIIRMDSLNLIAFKKEGFTGLSYPIQYFSSPPRREAYGWTFNAPWNPAMRPGDQVTIDPKYYKQTFVTFNTNFVPDAIQTGAGTALPMTPFTILTLEFDFNTIGPTNNMSLVVLDGSEASA